MKIEFTISGKPAPAGSYRPVPIRGGGSRIIDTNPRTKPWQAKVQDRAMDYMQENKLDKIAGGVVVVSEFYFLRPKYHYHTGRKKGGCLKSDAPHNYEHIVRPDVSKLARAIEDAMTGVVYVDDSQIVRHVATKHWIDNINIWPSCKIIVQPVDEAWFSTKVYVT